MATNVDQDAFSTMSNASSGGYLDHGGGVVLPYMESSGDDTKAPTLVPRAYQMEMLEESMQRNIIAVMDTGSGKTLVAVLRIEKELEHCAPEKMVWLLCPKVVLAHQQNKFIAGQLPAFQSRVLTGADGVDGWSTQTVWDDMLENIRIVVSTPQILLNALTHGFVKLYRIALLVIDEAHNCIGADPGNQIMRDFYLPLARTPSFSERLPSVLGLTASPSIDGTLTALKTVEQNLNAVCRSPNVNHDEMLRFVSRPELILLDCSGCHTQTQLPAALQHLGKVLKNLDIEEDPYVIQLKSEGNIRSRRLQQARLNRKTYCQSQIKGLYNKALNIYQELGVWATDFYIKACLDRYRNNQRDDTSELDFLQDEEKRYLKDILTCIEIPDVSALEECSSLSNKALRLISFLREASDPKFRGLVFVQTRATVVVLAHILSQHPWTRESFGTATFVGASYVVDRKASIGDLTDLRGQKDTLEDLLSGRKNLVVTTNALEEGIDVSACNTVVCYEEPKNLKSFIQRRGRARQSLAKYIIFNEKENEWTDVDRWRELELNLKLIYQNQCRQLQNIKTLEAAEEGIREFVVERTGAKITLENAVQHLNHFCDKMPASHFTDNRPLYTVLDVACTKEYTARVTLPISIDISVREASSISPWTTQKYAMREAAFEAYVRLYHAGLVNDNLLPSPKLDSGAAEISPVIERRVAIVQVAEQMQPWPLVANKWLEMQQIHEVPLKISVEGGSTLRMRMLLPHALSGIPEMRLYWDSRTIYTVNTEAAYRSVTQHYEEIALWKQVTELLLASVYRPRMPRMTYDFVMLFIPAMEHEVLRSWQSSCIGSKNAETMMSSTEDQQEIGLVRDLTRNGKPNIFHGFSSVDTGEFGDGEKRKEDADGRIACVSVTELPKRADFVHAIPTNNDSSSKSERYNDLPANTCQIDNLPFAYARFALFIPSIMHQIEISLIAEALCSDLLPSVRFQNPDLVTTALSTPRAQEKTNYEVLEFLGDSVLKFLTSLTLMAQHLNYHEGYLALSKDHVVSNGPLSAAAIRVGLDKYILDKPFTGRKWRPLYISELVSVRSGEERKMSTKTLADVVESLIGAAYLDGGLENAVACLQVFHPRVSWIFPDQAIQILNNVYDFDLKLPPHFIQVEEMIGYSFHHKGLLTEAMTHASCIGSHAGMSYQRLEFLGDAILDSIVVHEIFRHRSDLPHHIMHLIRTALVNANFLAFLCMSTEVQETRAEIVEDKATMSFSTVEKIVSRQLWCFMRHNSPSIPKAQVACASRFEHLRSPIREVLDRGSHYPWAYLASLEAPKFFSDVIESLLCAVYIDSHGSIPVCETFLEKLGLLGYLRRVLGQKIALLHPKEELGMLADSEEVKYMKGWEGEEDHRKLFCEVFVGKRKVARVSDGLGKIEVETRAAEAAVKILKTEKMD